MTPRRLQAEIHAFCEAHADARQVARYARYFREGYDAYGVHQDVWEAQKDAWVAAHMKALGLEGVLDLGDRLVSTGKYEEGSFAIYFVLPFRDEFNPPTFDRLGAWLDNGLRNWAHTDILSGAVLGRFLEDRVVPISRMAGWRTATSKWKRRAVPVTLLALLDRPARVPALLRFVRPMMRDNERVVQQGLGWFLREAWKVRPDLVEPFLLEWKDTAPRLIFQYATEKMTPRSKARFRRTRTR
jgi:3-methyladenine DNA glycosylase AlkD